MIDWLQPFFPDLNLTIIAVYAVLVGVVLAFFREWTAPDIVALSAMGALLLLGVLPLNDLVENGVVLERGILSVFSNGAPITVACMFILSAGLERTGVIDAMGKVFLPHRGEGRDPRAPRHDDHGRAAFGLCE